MDRSVALRACTAYRHAVLCTDISCYASATQCPVLTAAMLLPDARTKDPRHPSSARVGGYAHISIAAYQHGNTGTAMQAEQHSKAGTAAYVLRDVRYSLHWMRTETVYGATRLCGTEIASGLPGVQGCGTEIAVAVILRY
eukprot:2477762-Rhodomonas_salina.1